MNQVDDDLRRLILQSEAVRAIVEYDVIFTFKPEQIDPPYIVFSRISTTPALVLRGPSNLFTSRYEVDCFASDADQARLASQSVRTQLDGYKAAFGQTNFRGIRFTDEHAVFDIDLRVWRVISEYMVDWRKVS